MELKCSMFKCEMISHAEFFPVTELICFETRHQFTLGLHLTVTMINFF